MEADGSGTSSRSPKQGKPKRGKLKRAKGSAAKVPGKLQAFLIAVKQRRSPTRVYAVLAPSPEAALEGVQTLTADGMAVEIAGMLSKHMARSLKLKPGELRLV